MFKQYFNLLFSKKTLVRGSSVLAITTIASYALGIVRDRLFATTFGASITLDAYNASFLIPDLVLNIFVAGALTAAFIPLFTDLLSSRDENAMASFTSSVLNGALLMVIFAGSVLYLIIPWLSQWTVHGFNESARQLYVDLARLLLLSPIVFAISNTLGSILISRERFLWFGLSAPLYNLGIIGGVLWLTPTYGIFGVAYGAFAGAGLHLLARVIGLWRYDLLYIPRIRFDSRYKKFLWIMAPKMIGHPLEQLTVLGYTIIASGLGAGSIAIFTFARNFQYAPIAIIGINLAMAAFPTLSRAATRSDMRHYLHELKFTAVTIFVTTTVAALALYVLRHWIIDLLLGGGEYDAVAVASTASVLGVFCLSIPTESLNHLLARAFYAQKNSLIPVIVGLIGIVTALAVGYTLSLSMGINGLVLGFFLGSVFRLILLTVLLRTMLNSK